ncbi:uncharacterized protein I303_100652 [Kwoniella dejecticola CBS 10117]|uniref:Fork-head domain-containing protein n=1 Tax=Kwoniella dejecticola CBS 10117 TaxID=1296121 RepID=A0A1A6AFL2_9TREE|nr:uncharacterized protein I303_00656 [Kwoniella dejecticola CBS 10117]OBR88839.1 hypothetical protein I303_00656 [Kwoniella dejecticola CBS 10117]
MTRPASSTSHRPSRSGSGSASASNMGMMGGESMGRVHTFSPTPSASTSHHPIYYTHEQFQDGYIQPYNSYGGEIQGQMITPYAGHQVAQGRIAMPMHGHPGNVISINSNQSSRGPGKTPMRSTPPPPNGFDDLGPSPFLPEEDGTPYLPAHFEAYGQMSASPSMGQMQLSSNHLVSPTDQINMGRMAPQLHRTNTMPILGHPHQQQQQYQPLQAGRQRHAGQQGRPAMVQRQTMPGPIQRPVPLSRHASLHGPSRSASPHIGGDIFDPVPPGANGSPLIRQQIQSVPHQENMDISWDLSAFDPAVNPTGQGISPARALGPAPVHPIRFSPHAEAHMITPQNNKLGYPNHIHSSATSAGSLSTASSSISSMSDVSVRSAQHQRGYHHDAESDEDEHDSPTRGPSTSRAMMKMHLEEKRSSGSIPRQVKQVPKSTATGGRTSAKFAKVAEDPGVEGVPPGPRPMERPSPSFACIIGQAILRCKAGGLSLEHIYRYVETAYPFFKNGDGAWRNSVRHNLSIHKMFETIPRTEAFPPGKGGIWIIHEDEKCHWPAEDKFIKNFPPSHPHHGVCRQTLHERAKENEAMEKAAREGRVYVPKKGKKGRKLTSKDDEDEEGSMEMIRTSSALTEIPLQRTDSQQDLAGSSTPIPEIPEDESTTPKVQPKLLEPPPLDGRPSEESIELEDDEGDFLPMDDTSSDPAPLDVTPVDPVKKRDQQMARNGMMMPPRFERKEKRRPLEVEDDNVFITSTKRVRVAEPLQPIHPIPQETASVKELDDSFITPERERPASNNNKIMSSAFKTPALIQTSSSPGSSPMPATITRSTHHPSALQQAWTHDDMTENHGSRESSPARPMLESAFDFKPKVQQRRTLAQEDEYTPLAKQSTNHHSHVERAPPKTPVSRSSAATDKTPRIQHLRTPSLSKTPMFFGGSPALPPPSAGALLSTPMWEVGGVLDRLKDHLTGSPTSGSIRSPMPSTDPTRYAMLLDSGGSPRKRRDVSL